VSGKLTEHFTVAELNPKGHPLTLEQLNNLKALAIKLEAFRKVCGNRPITVTSGYRTPEHNRRVRGATNSYHLKGLAADIQVKGMSPQRVQRLAREHWPGGIGLGTTFTHLDDGPKRVFGY
jgi:uncharacterized protein YcbK (DUF882 family)